MVDLLLSPEQVMLTSLGTAPWPDGLVPSSLTLLMVEGLQVELRAQQHGRSVSQSCQRAVYSLEVVP